MGTHLRLVVSALLRAGCCRWLPLLLPHPKPNPDSKVSKHSRLTLPAPFPRYHPPRVPARWRRSAPAQRRRQRLVLRSPRATTKLTLHGGVPHPALAGLCATSGSPTRLSRGRRFSTGGPRLELYFLNLFESGMRDAADATHAPEGIRPKALEVLLAFIYEGKCRSTAS